MGNFEAQVKTFPLKIPTEEQKNAENGALINKALAEADKDCILEEKVQMESVPKNNFECTIEKWKSNSS